MCFTDGLVAFAGFFSASLTSLRSMKMFILGVSCGIKSELSLCNKDSFLVQYTHVKGSNSPVKSKNREAKSRVFVARSEYFCE